MSKLELSVVIPCLNEVDTVGACVGLAIASMRTAGIFGEVIVADNGSHDGSQEIAIAVGAKVVDVAVRGYGNALRGGIEASCGECVLMGDADASYDYADIPNFVEKLRIGYDLVQGCRLPSGGGHVLPGAMPILHRWIGNPILTRLVRIMFGVPIHDVYCGLRAFTREAYNRLDLRSDGMEFATEMIIQANLRGLSIAEVPITLHPDGRRAHGPHLRTLRDGWRTLRLFLIYSPRWTFFYPGALLMLVGMIGYGLALPQVRIAGAALDVHTLMIASLAMILGWQSILLASLASIFASREGLLPSHRSLEKISVEQALLVGAISTAIGVAFIAVVVVQWIQSNFGPLNYPQTMRWVVPGAMLVTLGFQTAMSALMAGVLKMQPSRSP